MIPNKSGSRFRHLVVPPMLTGVILLSVVLRLASAIYEGNTVEVLPGVADQLTYHTLATRVLEGHGFSFGTNWWPATLAGSPTAHWSFLYTLYLTGIYYVFGINPLVARILQVLIVGVLHPLLVWRIGSRVFGGRVGLTAAAITAAYGYFVYYAGALMTESFFIVAILWVMDTATDAAVKAKNGARLNGKTWLLLGLGAGTAILLRQLFMFFLPFLLVWLWYALRRYCPTRQIVSAAFALCLIPAVMVLPWTARNYFAFKRFVLLNTNAGFAFFWANHPVHGTSFIPIFRDDGPSYGALIPGELLKLDEASLDRQLLRAGLRFVAQDPGRYALLSLSRTREYFRFWPSAESSRAANLVRALSFGLFSPFMVIGVASTMIFWFRNKGASAPQASQYTCHFLFLMFVAVYTGMHLLSWALIRYRLPADGILILYAAYGFIRTAECIPALGPLVERRQ
jgi:4-amino-4-deoxy-L-arabinose transferase-like glycosyltransferase